MIKLWGIGMILTGVIAFLGGWKLENGDITAAVFFWIIGIMILIEEVKEGIK